MAPYTALKPSEFDEERSLVQIGEAESDLNIKSSSLGPQPLVWQSKSTNKIRVTCASVVPLLVSISLLVMFAMQKTTSGPLLVFVLDNRVTAQIVVSIVSAVLATLNIYTLTTLLNFATRIHVVRNTLSLNTIKLIGAITTKNFITSLPSFMSTTTAILVVLFAIPNILWTGALTPALTVKDIAAPGALKVPQYSKNSNASWFDNDRPIHGKCSIRPTPKGIFSNCPSGPGQSSLLSRAAQATVELQQNQTHAKNDNSHYSFRGRSYGIGATAGLADDSLYTSIPSKLLSYSYVEPGWLANVSCERNSSMEFGLVEVQTPAEGRGVTVPTIYYAQGRFPNADDAHYFDYFSVPGLGGSDNIAVLAAKRYSERNVILTAAGANYPDLDEMQCEVELKQVIFNVSVDVSNKSITVHPTAASPSTLAASPSLDVTPALASTVMDQLNGLGMISTTAYLSVVGDALMANINASSGTAPTALAVSFTAMIDDILLAIASSQFFVPNDGAGDVIVVDTNLTVQAVRLGEAPYVYAVFVLCVLLVIGTVAEAVRTRWWRLLPRWDPRDPTCLMLAGAVAGNELLQELHSQGQGRQGLWKDRKEKDQHRGEIWNGDGYVGVPNIQVGLGQKVVPSSTAQSEPQKSCNEGTREGGQEQLTAVSLWTSKAKGASLLM